MTRVRSFLTAIFRCRVSEPLSYMIESMCAANFVQALNPIPVNPEPQNPYPKPRTPEPLNRKTPSCRPSFHSPLARSCLQICRLFLEPKIRRGVCCGMVIIRSSQEEDCDFQTLRSCAWLARKFEDVKTLVGGF